MRYRLVATGEDFATWAEAFHFLGILYIGYDEDGLMEIADAEIECYDPDDEDGEE